VGTLLVTDGATVDTAGGAMPGSDPGDTGRLLLGDNRAAGYAGDGTFQTPETGPGSRGPNPFLTSQTETPYLPEVLNGAEVYGLTALSSMDFPDILSAAPQGTFAALLRMDVGPGLPDFVGFDALFFINTLWGTDLADPQFGIGEDGTLFSHRLIEQGWARDPFYGGGGPEELGLLASQGVYATLIPEGLTGRFSMCAELDGQLFVAVLDDLQNGEALFLVPEPPTGAVGVLLVTGVMALRLRKRRGSR
jgi:hypothetical protein